MRGGRYSTKLLFEEAMRGAPLLCIVDNPSVHYMRCLLAKDSIRRICLHASLTWMQTRARSHSVCTSRSASTQIPFTQYELPDGKTIDVGPERYKTCELMFNPSLLEVRHLQHASLCVRMFASLSACACTSRLWFFSRASFTPPCLLVCTQICASMGLCRDASSDALSCAADTRLVA